MEYGEQVLWSPGASELFGVETLKPRCFPSGTLEPWTPLGPSYQVLLIWGA